MIKNSFDAIVLTTVMLTTLFTVGSSIMKSIEISTKKQIAAMLSYEGVFRVLLTFAIVLTIGQLFNYVIVYLMAGEMIMFSYKYVVWPMLLCIPVFLIIATVIPRIIGRNNINLAR